MSSISLFAVDFLFLGDCWGLLAGQAWPDKIVKWAKFALGQNPDPQGSPWLLAVVLEK